MRLVMSAEIFLSSFFVPFLTWGHFVAAQSAITCLTVTHDVQADGQLVLQRIRLSLAHEWCCQQQRQTAPPDM